MSKTCLKLVSAHDFDYPKHKSRERGLFISLFIRTAYRYIIVYIACYQADFPYTN